VQDDAFFDVLGAVRVVVVGAFGWEFFAANGAFVFFGDLAARTRLCLLRLEGRWDGSSYRLSKHVCAGDRAVVEV
jgi:hypothetical protein